LLDIGKPVKPFSCQRLGIGVENPTEPAPLFIDLRGAMRSAVVWVQGRAGYKWGRDHQDGGIQMGDLYFEEEVVVKSDLLEDGAML